MDRLAGEVSSSGVQLITADWLQKFAGPADVLHRRRAEILSLEGAVDARLGFLARDGLLTREPAVVVAIAPWNVGAQVSSRPTEIEGVPLDYVRASPEQQLALADAADAAGTLAASRSRTLVEDLADILESGDNPEDDDAPAIGYRPPPDGPSLESVTGPMRVTCHLSPDAGWRVLQPFLAGTQRTLSVAMYDFSAPHIMELMGGVLRRREVRLKLVLDPGTALPTATEIERDPDSPKAKDHLEENVLLSLRRAGGRRMEAVFASTGAGGTFKSAYHTKVAVRDSTAFWLSSGNWQSSNQPAVDFLVPGADLGTFRRYNREWHVVIEHQGLAELFEAYIDWDFEQAHEDASDALAVEPAPKPDLLVEPGFLFEEADPARLQVFSPFIKTFTVDEPLTVRPLMTPDNYIAHATALVRSARTSLLFQNQSLGVVKRPTPAYLEFLAALRDKCNDPSVDARFIVRRIGSVREKMESLQLFGFDLDRVKLHAGCHTKGIVVDGRVVLVGSHNCTNEGTQVNRDASVIIEDAQVAAYFGAAFEHDWDVLAKHYRFHEGDVPLIATAGGDPRLIRVTWPEFEDE